MQITVKVDIIFFLLLLKFYFKTYIFFLVRLSNHNNVSVDLKLFFFIFVISKCWNFVFVISKFLLFGVYFLQSVP